MADDRALTPPPTGAVDRAWPAQWAALPPGATRVATQERVPLGAVTGSVQGEVRRALVDEKRAQIDRALAGDGRLPEVKLVPDPRNPGGYVAIDQNHTLQAYREAGFRDVPGYVYNDAGVRSRIDKGEFHPDRIFDARDVRVVDQFSGTPRQQWDARTTPGSSGGTNAQGICSNCGTLTPGSPGIDGPAPTPPPIEQARPADADEAFRRAQRTGGSQVGGVVYGVGGTPDNPQVYKFSPDGRYMGTAPIDRLPVAAEMGVSDQVMRMQNPGAPMARFVDAPDGRRYAVGGPSGILVDEAGTLRPVTAAERATLPRTVQTKLMMRAAGPALALPDGVNGMGRRIGGEFLNNWVDGVQLNMDADRRFGSGAEPTPEPRPPARR